MARRSLLLRHREAVRDRRFTPLRRTVRLPVWGDLGLRLGAALLLVSLVILLHWLDRARTVLVSAGRDDASILMVLTARHLAPDVPISVVIRAADNEVLALQAGADNVINPVRFAGLLLAGSARGAHTAEYLADLASVGGRVELVERPVAPEEIGKPLGELASGGQGLRVYRNGRPYGFWDPEARSLQPGDVVVEVQPTRGAEAGES